MNEQNTPRSVYLLVSFDVGDPQCPYYKLVLFHATSIEGKHLMGKYDGSPTATLVYSDYVERDEISDSLYSRMKEEYERQDAAIKALSTEIGELLKFKK